MTPEHEPLVTDRRSFPNGLLSKNAKVMVMGGLAVVIVVVITVSEKPPASMRPLAVPGTAGLTLTPEQVQGLQETLEAGLERGQLSTVPVPTPVADPQPRGGGTPRVAAPAISDAERQERKQKDYESLFASNLVFSRRADAQPDAPRRGPLLTGDEDAQAFQPPSVDDVTQSVVKALQAATSGGQVVPAAQAAPAPPAVTVKPAPPARGHTVSEGTVIDATLATRLDGSMEGPVNALVSVPVFAQDRTLVIPAGSRVLGIAKPIQSLDDSRLAVAFHRVVMPSGQDVSLNQFVGMNVRGDVGLSGEVNRHYLSTFGAAAAVGLIAGLAQWAGSGFGSASARAVVVSGVGDSAAQATTQTMARFLNRRPTITISEGSRLKIYITSDLSLPAYRSAP